MMVFTMFPAAAWAGDNVKTAGDEQELVQVLAEAKDGDTVRLTEDIAMTPPTDVEEDILYPLAHIANDITLDLNGKKIYYEENAYAGVPLNCTPVFLSVEGGAKVTITGNGTIDAECGYNNSYGVDIRDNGSVIVENGTFTGATTALQVTKGTLTIHDGTFIQAETIASAVPEYAKYVINCIDASFANGTARIYAQGGKYCFDPANKPEASEVTYVPAGYASKQQGEYWVVEQLPYVASIGSDKYYSLAEAVAAAKDGQTVTLLANASGSGIGTFKGNEKYPVKNFTIDFAGFTYTCTGPAVGSSGTQSQAFHLEWNGSDAANANVTLKNGTLTSSSYTDSGVLMLVQNYCNLTVDNMILDGSNLPSDGYTLSNNCGNVTIKDSTLIAPNGAVAFDVCDYASYTGITVTVEGKSFIQGKVEVVNSNGNENNAKLILKSGYYTVGEVATDYKDATAPLSNYLGENLSLVPSDTIGYSYMVIEKTIVGEVEIVPDVADPDVKEIKDTAGMDEEEQGALKDAAETVEVGGMVSVGQNVVENITEDDVKEATKQLETDVGVSETQTVTLYVQTYLDITPISYNSTDKVLTLDITPMIQVVASTAEKAEDIVTDENSQDTNAVIYQEPQKLEMTQPVTVVVGLPDLFTMGNSASTAYVVHTKANNKQYVYDGTVAENHVLTFTNPNGFSEFTVYASDPSVARVYAASEDLENDSGVGYMTLQDAVNAVKTGGTIIANQDGEATVSDSKSFTVIDNGKDITLFAGKNYRMEKENAENGIVYTFTYRGGSSSDDSSVGSPLPTVPTEPGEPTDPTDPSTPSGFVSDTTNDLTVNGTYQFRITSLDGTIPFLTVDNANFRVEFASQEGNDFFFKIHAQGAAGSTAVVSVNGVRLLTATVGGSATGVISDTTAPFTVKKGETYQFRLTASERPSFAAGSASFTVEYAGQIGSDYFYKVYAAGNVGDGCGFYINGEASPVAVATIA